MISWILIHYYSIPLFFKKSQYKWINLENSVTLTGNGGYNMTEYFNQLDTAIAEHLKGIRKSLDIENDNEALEVLAQAWIEKEDAFNRQIDEKSMETVEEFDPDTEEGGVLLLTYSGSLLSIGPRQNNLRSASYASIGLRQDVREFAEEEDAQLEGPVRTGDLARFVRGPVQSSSKIYKMAIFKEEMDAAEEEELLAEVTQILAEDFTEVNRTIIAGE